MGAYHSTKNFEIFETGTNGTEISREKNFENLGIPYEVVLVYGIYANSQYFILSAS